MEKIDKNNFFYLILLFFTIFSFFKSFADTNSFLSLKNDEVNLRKGPSFEYPIKFIYKKKYLPVIIIDESETWKKIIFFMFMPIIYPVYLLMFKNAW